MELVRRRVKPHLAQNTSGRRSASTAGRPHHPGYALSQRARKRIEETFGWKDDRPAVRTKLRGLARVRWSFTLAAAAYNLIRLPKLIGAMP